MGGADPNPAGYSGTPLHRKLGVKPGARVLVADAPAGFDLARLAPPDLAVDLVELGGEELSRRASTRDGDSRGARQGAGDVLLIFCPDAGAMSTLLPAGMALTARGRTVLGRVAEAGLGGADRPDRGRRPRRRARRRMGGRQGRGRRRNMVGSVPDAPHGRAVEVQGLTKFFGDVVAVRDLSFTVLPGRVTGFLGPNGAGKTTTLRILLGLVRATRGTATIGGRRYADLPSPQTSVGALLEASSFHPGRTARDSLRVRSPAGSDQRRAGGPAPRAGRPHAGCAPAGRRVLAGDAPAAGPRRRRCSATRAS